MNEQPIRHISLLQESSVVDPDKPIFERRSANNGPRFSTGEVAKTFFAWTPRYLLLMGKEGVIDIDDPEDEHYRRFTLADVEKMALALRKADKLTTSTTIDILTAVYHIARVWRLI